jgi:hypothetical protein
MPPMKRSRSRVRAAQCVIELTQTGFASEDVEVRVAQLEQLAEKAEQQQ